MVPLYAARVQDLGPGANHRATCPDRGTIDAYGFAPRLPEVHTSSWLGRGAATDVRCHSVVSITRLRAPPAPA